MKIIKISLIILFISTINTYAGSNHYEKYYEYRIQQIKSYISKIKSGKKNNSNYKGSIVESLNGQFFIQYGTNSQKKIDQKALSICKKSGGVDCLVRFRNLSINNKYNRYAKFINSKQHLDVIGKKIKSKKVSSVSGIDILVANEDYKTSANGLTCEKAKSSFHYNEAINYISNEIRIYPTRFLKESGLKYVMICENISGGKNVNVLGFAQSHIDQSTGVFYLNLMQLATSPNKKEHLKKTFHHEFYHLIDAELSLLMLDTKWSKFSPNQYDRSLSGEGKGFYLNNSVKGFISRYARNSIAEDKAEMFAFMIGRHKDVQAVIKKDETVKKKYELMRFRLNGISNSINKSFWNNIR